MSSKAKGWSPATGAGGFRSDRLKDATVALRAMTDDEETIETSQGANQARWVEAIIIDPVDGDGPYVNAGEVPIFWQIVRRQIDQSRSEWVVGTVVKQGRAFRLAPPPATLREAIGVAIKRHESSNPVDFVPDEPDDDDSQQPDEAPF